MKKTLESERAKDLSRRVSELKRELEPLSHARQDAFRELLAEKTGCPRKRIAQLRARGAADET